MPDFLCAIPILAGFLSACGDPAPLATGYVEGEYVQVAPIAAARVTALSVARGDTVAAGDPLATVEATDATIALAAADAALQRAESELANLQQGSREEELAVLRAAVSSARANADRSAKEADRQRELLRQRVVSQAAVDAAVAAADMAAASVAEAEARLSAAQLPARPHQIDAASAAVAQARASRDAAQWALDQRALTAGAAGIVTDILRYPGELAGPSAPVVTYLPDGAVKLRLYLPEPDLSRVALGSALNVSCDGCAPEAARITYIADQAEFTPPVIYSRDARQKLVYMIEARPVAGSALKPGQIVDVRLTP